MSTIDEPKVVNAVKEHLESFPDVDGVADELTFVRGGLTCDVVGYSNRKIKYIVECKGNLSPGGIAGGIGQAYQYEYQKQYSGDIALDSEVVFACPIEMKDSLNLMNIPNEIKEVWLVDNDSKIWTYKKTSKGKGEVLLHIAGTVYLEAMKVSTLKILLNTLARNESKNNMINEDIILQDINEITDWRNLFISINKLGLTSDKKLTPKGYELYGYLKKSDAEFERELTKILQPTIDVVLNAIIIFSKETKQDLSDIKFTQLELEAQIEKIFGEKVNYFDHRRLSYIINILCELKFITKLNRSRYRVEKISST